MALNYGVVVEGRLRYSNPIMKIKVTIVLIILLAAGDIHAVRSSSRNFKSLKEQQEEKAAAEKAAKQAAAEAAEYRDGAHLKSAVERVTFLGPKTGWGFVKKESTYYSPDGKNMGELKAGTLFKYQDVKTTSKNDMLLAQLRDKSGWHGPYLLPCTEVAAYEGDPEKVDIQIVADLRRYFLLKGDVDQYKEALLNREYRKNPYYTEYKNAAKKYKDSLTTASQMEQKADKLTGIRKTNAYDELRKFKYQQAELKVNLEQIGTKYKAWKKQHPVDLNTVKDNKLVSIQNELEKVKSRVPELIPPEE